MGFGFSALLRGRLKLHDAGQKALFFSQSNTV